MAEKPIKVDKWDTNATKNAIDDGIKKILKEEFKFEEKFRLIDGRLILSTLAVLCGGVAMLYDWLYPFPASKYILIICVLLYFLLTGILTFYIMFIEKNTFMLANENDKAGLDLPIIWTLQSTLKKYQDKYELKITRNDQNNKMCNAVEHKKTIATFFDIKGNLRSDLLNKFVSDFKLDLEKKKSQ